MANDSKSPAVAEDIYDIHSRFLFTEMAIGYILSSLSKRVNLEAVFEEAWQASRSLSDYEQSLRVGQIIESIGANANSARNIQIPSESDLPEEHRGCDINGIPNNPNHPWRKELPKDSQS